MGVAIGEREIVERGKCLGAGASGEHGLAEVLGLCETAHDVCRVFGEEEIEHFADRDLVVVCEFLGRHVVVEEGVEDGAEEGVHGGMWDGGCGMSDVGVRDGGRKVGWAIEGCRSAFGRK